MANIFLSGDELLNKKDFDKKVNIANSIGNDLDYKSLVASANWSDIAKLEQEIADLKKQNGGVRQPVNPLVSMLYVPSFEMEVA